MKQTALILCVLAAFAASAAPTNRTSRAKGPRLTAAERMRQRNGEKIEKPGTGKGRIVFVDATKSLNGALAAWVRELSGEQALHMETVSGAAVTVESAPAESAKLGAAAVVFVQEEGALPMSLVAYEGKWAVVNLKEAMAGVPPVIGSSRAKKLVYRTYANLCGAGEGVYGGGLLMSPVKTPEDLDAVRIEFPMPLPLLGAIGNHMVKAGMEATVTAYYRQACTEGWAPAPTNEVQKAIWDKVHAIPAKPMKIEFDPKTGK